MIMEGEKMMRLHNSSRSLRQKNRRRGVSLIESLIASVIIATALIALVSTWLYVVRAALLSDDRSAGYEVARTVLERARNTGGAINQPVMTSAPADGNIHSRWTSPSLLRNRFYDAKLDEVGGGSNADNPPAPPPDAAFRAITTVTVSPDLPRRTCPVGRDDLRLVTITVVIHKVNPDGTVQADPISTLQTCLTQGGLL